jgi:hypothetical protein
MEAAFLIGRVPFGRFFPQNGLNHLNDPGVDSFNKRVQ